MSSLEVVQVMLNHAYWKIDGQEMQSHFDCRGRSNPGFVRHNDESMHPTIVA